VGSSTTGVQPNILFILADDLGYGDISAVNGGITDTPVLDQLIEESLNFEHQYAASPVCNPSRASLLTGRYPHRTGSIDTLEWRGLERLALDEVTLPELLSRSGYRTAHIGKWHLGAFDSRYSPRNRGFHESVCFKGGGHDYYDWRIEYNDVPVVSDGRYLTDVWTDEAVAFLERQDSRKPFYLNLCYNAPHTPLQVPDEEAQVFRDRGEFSEDVCRVYGMIRRLDKGIGRVLDSLEKLGLHENTVVVFTSDNGPEFMSDYLTSPTHTERFNCNFRGSKGSVYEGGIRVPLMVRWPAGIGGGRSVGFMAHFTDWFTTLLAVAQADIPHDRAIDGVNLLSAMTGSDIELPDERFWQWNRYSPVPSCNAAVRAGRWKLVYPEIPEAMKVFDVEWLQVSMYNPDYFIDNGIISEPDPERQLSPPAKPQLYDLIDDPLETTDVAGDHPQIVHLLSEKIENWFDMVEMDRRRNQ
jgi:arylsulfatase A-like enzyme